MLEVTGWAVATWLRITLALTAAVGVAWLLLGSDSGWFWVISATAATVDLFLARQLTREWYHEARLRWWWTR